MAAGFARRMAASTVEIVSGGTLPGQEVNRIVVDAMREVGVDLSREKPRRIGAADLANCDVVVSMGCSSDDVCPAGFRGDARDWALPDPKGRSIGEVRRIRDEIERRVRDLLREVSRQPPKWR
jgi:protein-tyrosine-phosphatase